MIRITIEAYDGDVDFSDVLKRGRKSKTHFNAASGIIYAYEACGLNGYRSKGWNTDGMEWPDSLKGKQLTEARDAVYEDEAIDVAKQMIADGYIVRGLPRKANA
jgi:hypothetical protein